MGPILHPITLLRSEQRSDRPHRVPCFSHVLFLVLSMLLPHPIGSMGYSCFTRTPSAPHLHVNAQHHVRPRGQGLVHLQQAERAGAPHPVSQYPHIERVVCVRPTLVAGCTTCQCTSLPITALRATDPRPLRSTATALLVPPPPFETPLSYTACPRNLIASSLHPMHGGSHLGRREPSPPAAPGCPCTRRAYVVHPTHQGSHPAHSTLPPAASQCTSLLIAPHAQPTPAPHCNAATANLAPAPETLLCYAPHAACPRPSLRTHSTPRT